MSPAVGVPMSKLDSDEREDFLRRENELSDSLAEKETVLVEHEKTIEQLREELAAVKEENETLKKVPSRLIVVRASYLPLNICVLIDKFCRPVRGQRASNVSRTAGRRSTGQCERFGGFQRPRDVIG